MTTTNVSDPLVGHVLDGRYEVVHRIARGGMATVYRAVDRRLTRLVAIKVMHEGLGDDHDFARKFDREARAAARLSHPHVVSVFDQGHDKGRPYIVMEYVEGCTLRHLITREAPLDPVRCLELLEPVVSALAAAHEAGLIHRDIKPENVLISDRGQIKVADFGLAKAITAQTATATQGLLIGTVSYLPPELVQHGRVDPRSDVYSTGVVLFEMLTGTKPHTGETPIQVAYAHVHEDVPAPSARLQERGESHRNVVPAYLDALVTRAAAREPSGRPANARVLLEHLRAAHEALVHGIVDDPALVERFTQPTADEATAPVVLPGSPASPSSAVTTDLRRLRATPSTPISPVDFENSFDGATFYEDGEPSVRQSLPRPLAAATVGEPERRAAKQRPAKPRPTPLTPVEAAQLRQRQRRRRGIAILLAMILATFGVSYGAYSMTAGRMVAVPAVAGLPQEQAMTTLDRADLDVTVTEEFSESVAKGSVISERPAEGDKVEPGSAVTIVVSKGPERFAVPTLVGLTRSEAGRALARVHLKVGKVTEAYHDKAKSGVVVKAGAEVGTQVKRGTTVDLTVSKGPRPISIKNFKGKDAEAAKKALEKLGFVVTTKGAYSKKIAEGVVISQTPANGTGYRGTKITLVTSLGPRMIEIPKVRNKKLGEAKTLLVKAGFKVKVVKPLGDLGFGIVAYSRPGQGKKAAEGSTITLYVA